MFCQTLQALKLTYNNPVTQKSKFYAAISSKKPEISFRNYSGVNSNACFHTAVKFQSRLGWHYIGHALNAEDQLFAPESYPRHQSVNYGERNRSKGLPKPYRGSAAVPKADLASPVQSLIYQKQWLCKYMNIMSTL